MEIGELGQSPFELDKFPCLEVKFSRFSQVQKELKKKTASKKRSISSYTYSE